VSDISLTRPGLDADTEVNGWAVKPLAYPAPAPPVEPGQPAPTGFVPGPRPPPGFDRSPRTFPSGCNCQYGMTDSYPSGVSHLSPETLEQLPSLASFHLRRTEAPFSATASRMRALNAFSSIFSPS
jgi:hypothetical protein